MGPYPMPNPDLPAPEQLLFSARTQLYYANYLELLASDYKPFKKLKRFGLGLAALHRGGEWVGLYKSCCRFLSNEIN